MKLIVMNNNEKINQLAVKKVEGFLQIAEKDTRAFDRQNSQTTLQMMSITMMSGQSPMRMLRQILAETEKRQMALNEAQLNLAKKEAIITTLENENITKEIVAKILEMPELIYMNENQIKILKEAKVRMEKTNGEQMLNKVNGSLKDLATLAEAYESIKAKHNISDEWDEEMFETEEKRHHIRRGFELLYHDLIEFNKPKKATIEYLQQFGVHVQVATKLTGAFIQQTEEAINNGLKDGKIVHANEIEKWLDRMSFDFIKSPDLTSERIFGKEDIIHSQYMLLKGGTQDDNEV